MRLFPTLSLRIKQLLFVVVYALYRTFKMYVRKVNMKWCVAPDQVQQSSKNEFVELGKCEGDIRKIKIKLW